MMAKQSANPAKGVVVLTASHTTDRPDRLTCSSPADDLGVSIEF